MTTKEELIEMIWEKEIDWLLREEVTKEQHIQCCRRFDWDYLVDYLLYSEI